MRKVFCLLIVCGWACPAWSQSGKSIKTWWKALTARPSITARVSQAVARRAASVPGAVGVQVAKISNLPGSPLVRVNLPQTETAGSHPLPARVLPPGQLCRAVNPAGFSQLYIPSAFAMQRETLYRGLRLNHLQDLKNILTRGMEISRSQFSVIYSSYLLDIALGYMLPPGQWVVYENLQELDFELPVVVKIPVTIRLLEKNTPFEGKDEVFFRQDLWPEFISDVMVFLEINGQADWYRATVENGELVLTPTPTQRVPGKLDSY